MKPRRLLPYLAALLLLAWILGSLARSGTSGGSLLSNSYWLVYAIELLPLVALGMMVVLGIFLIINWKLLSDVLGFGMAGRRRVLRKKNRTLQFMVWATAWAVAIGVLLAKCGGIVCSSAHSAQTTAGAAQNAVTPGGQLPQVPLLGPLLTLSSLVDTNLIIYAFFGLVAVSSVIMVRAFKVSMDEKEVGKEDALARVQEGQAAVQDAIRMLDEDVLEDPRTKILACYQRMIKAAMDLGAPVGPDRTARELEKGIREMFLLKGEGIANLTVLFEEARYSLHPVSEEDSRLAREYLMEIREELSGTARLAGEEAAGTASLQA